VVVRRVARSLDRPVATTMPGERAGSSLVDVLDRLLDKGIVIDVRPRSGRIGIDVASGRATVRVVAIETYERRSEPHPSAEAAAGPAISDLRAELSRVRRDSDPTNGYEDGGS
jgi:gas vesicle structural protein